MIDLSQDHSCLPAKNRLPFALYELAAAAVPKRERILCTETGAVRISGVKGSNAVIFGFYLVID